MPSSHLKDKLGDVLDGEGCVRSAPDCDPADMQRLVDDLDEALKHLEPSNPMFRECLCQLGSICSTRTMLPESYILSSHPLKVNPFPFAQMGYCDIYGGSLDGSVVCVKRVRTYAQDVQQKAVKAFYKEAVLWKPLTHPNVVSLLGITTTPLQLILANPGRDIPEYIKENPDRDRPKLLSDVAEGLSYLHSCNVIHGALKGSSVLVDARDRAQITDFCSATIATDVDYEPSISHVRDRAIRWTAPEVLKGGKHSKRADIFSLAMLTIEIFAGTIPFHDAPSYMAMSEIVQGNRPPRPKHPAFTEHLWSLTRRCWDGDPHLRPGASAVLKALLASSASHPFSWLSIRPWKWLIAVTNDPAPVRERISPMAPAFDREEHPSGEPSALLCYERCPPIPTKKYTLLTMPGDYGFLLRDSLNEPIIQGVSQNASRFLDPPQAGNPGWGSIRSWLARIARNFFSAIKEKAMRGYARLGKY